MRDAKSFLVEFAVLLSLAGLLGILLVNLVDYFQEEARLKKEARIQATILHVQVGDCLNLIPSNEFEKPSKWIWKVSRLGKDGFLVNEGTGTETYIRYAYSAEMFKKVDCK